MTFSKEFKEAISYLPGEEKDKLILRLLKKDLVLANRLHFELVNTDSVEEKREKLKKVILKRVKFSSERFVTMGYLNMDVRDFSGTITEHVQITKDKFGEVYLNLVMINEVLTLNKSVILTSRPPRKTRKFCVAVIARAFKILLLANKLHEDYLFELKDEMYRFGELIGDNDFLMKEAIYNGFDVNWLLLGEIPEDIVTIHKTIRAQGFLK